MKSISTLSFCLCILSYTLQAQNTPDYSFVTVGCNRVDYADTIGNSPSTANVYQLKRLFSEVSRLHPLPAYLFFTGDLVIGYTTDTLKLAEQLKGWIAIYKASPLYGKSTQLVVVPGNHETQDKASGKKSFPAAERTFVREMNDYILNKNGPVATGLVSGTDSLLTDQSKLTYSFDSHQDHFVLVNTDPVGRDARVPTKWIASDIAAAKKNGARHVFIFGHKPAYGSVLKPNDGLPEYAVLRDVFWHTLEEHQCEAMFAAHNHTWEALQPHAGKTWQIIAGNGGSPLEKESSTPYFGFTLVHVYKNGNITVESLGRDLNSANYSLPADSNLTTLRESYSIQWGQTKTKDPSSDYSLKMIADHDNSETLEIKIVIPLEEEVCVKFYDVQGRPVLTVVNGVLKKGTHSFFTPSSLLKSGKYQLLMVCHGQTFVEKIIIP